MKNTVSVTISRAQIEEKKRKIKNKIDELVTSLEAYGRELDADGPPSVSYHVGSINQAMESVKRMSAELYQDCLYFYE